MMSAIDSRPTESRMSPGVTELAACSSGVSWLWVVRPVDHEASDVADVGDVAVQVEGFHELLAGFESAVDLEGSTLP